MKNRVINRILMSVIVILIIAICVISIQIIRRPHYINIAEADTAAIIEEATTTEAAVGAEVPADETAATQEAPSTALRGKTSTKVNIRDAASDQAKVLATVEADYEFDIVEIQDNGWTKIKYEDQDAYISSSYVIIIQ